MSKINDFYGSVWTVFVINLKRIYYFVRDLGPVLILYSQASFFFVDI